METNNQNNIVLPTIDENSITLYNSKTFEIEQNDVHIWIAAKENHLNKLEQFLSFLSDKEISRSSKFIYEDDKDSFIIRHGTLRSILSKYLKVAPKDVKFFYNSFDKPFLKIDDKENILKFNLSFSKNIAAITVCKDDDVGIDIENISKDVEFEQIAKRRFNKPENEFLLGFTDELSLEDKFFYIWTRKEAILKGTGKGIFNKYLKEINVLNDFVNLPNEFAEKVWKLKSIKLNQETLISVASAKTKCNYLFFQFN